MEHEKEKEKIIKKLTGIRDKVDNTIKEVKKAETSIDLMTVLINSKILVNEDEEKEEK